MELIQAFWAPEMNKKYQAQSVTVLKAFGKPFFSSSLAQMTYQAGAQMKLYYIFCKVYGVILQPFVVAVGGYSEDAFTIPRRIY